MKYTEGWNNTKSLGDVYLDDKGMVVRTVRNDVAVYPYKWDRKLNCWNECTHEYKPAYLAKLMREGNAMWR